MLTKIILMLLVGLSSFAGIRVVGNGGGLGEMKAVYVFQNIEWYLKPCLKNTSACQLNTADVAVLEKIIQILPLERARYNLEFYTSQTSEDFLTGNDVGSKLLINSAALSDVTGQPFSTNEIGKIILRALLQHLKIQTPSLPEKIFLNLQELAYSISLNSGMVHWLKITQLNQFIGDELFFEKPNKTYDLFPLFNRLALCKDSKALVLRILDLSKERVTSEFMTLNIQWSCGETAQGLAKVNITPSFTADGQLDLAQSIVQIYSIIPPR